MEGIEPRNRDVYNPVEEVNTPTFRPGESPELSEPLSNQAEKSAEQPDTDTQSAEDTITIPRNHMNHLKLTDRHQICLQIIHPGFKGYGPSPKEDSGESIGESGQTLPESLKQNRRNLRKALAQHHLRLNPLKTIKYCESLCALYI